MRAADLLVQDLLEMPEDGGIFRFGGERALVFDAVALGLLRQHLIEAFTPLTARCVLTRLGYTHGWRTAETMRSAVDWADEREWRIAGGRLHRLQGMVSFEPVRNSRRDPPAFAEAVWRDSFEAEQHILHLGQSDEPVCWTLTGFASGYLSRVTGERVYCIEERCVGRGDETCHMVGRMEKDWGPEIEPHRVFYERESLDASLEGLRDLLKRADAKLRRRRRALGPASADEGSVEHGIVARSAEMQNVLHLARRVAAVDSTALVRGESGVGKERVARYIHDTSAREAKPFLAVNCGALPETLLESELFGHVKGAFTGAASDRPGLFEAARGGTLFLDEIGEISPAMQVRLLRVLQERAVKRVGDDSERPVDVRIVAATHRDLEAAVAAGGFREDLYYRLNVLEVVIPPLRHRPDDILPLARHQLADTARRFRRDVTEISPEAARRLVAHPWPGNVRELHNAIERAVVFAAGSALAPEDLPGIGAATPVPPDGAPIPRASAAPPGRDPPPVAGPRVEAGAPLHAVERAHILATLEACGGNRAEAARRLEIGIATLYRKLRRYRADDGGGLSF